MKLEIRIDAEGVVPGGELTGHVVVLEGGRSRSLTLTGRFCERSPSFLSIPFSASGIIHEGGLQTGQEVEFRYEVPDWATPGVRGKNGELFWELEAVSDEPGLDTRATSRLEVASRRDDALQDL